MTSWSWPGLPNGNTSGHGNCANAHVPKTPLKSRIAVSSFDHVGVPSFLNMSNNIPISLDLLNGGMPLCISTITTPTDHEGSEKQCPPKIAPIKVLWSNPPDLTTEVLKHASSENRSYKSSVVKSAGFDHGSSKTRFLRKSLL